MPTQRQLLRYIITFIFQAAYARSTNWRCSVRSKSLWCKATITQRGNNFVPGPNPHIHPSDPGLLKKTKIRADVNFYSL